MRIFSTKIRKRILCAAAAAVIAVSGTGMTAMPVFGKETEGGQETDMRVEQAEKAMQSFLDRFYVVDEDNDRGEIVGEFSGQGQKCLRLQWMPTRRPGKKNIRI